jgi:hypothetical protein
MSSPFDQDVSNRISALLKTEMRPMQHASEIWGLCKSRGRIDTPDDEGLTPLLRCLGWALDAEAPPQDHEEARTILRALLGYARDIDARTPEGLTAADLAALWDDGGTALRMVEDETFRRSDAALRRYVRHIELSWPRPGDPPTEKVQKDFIDFCRQQSNPQIVYYLHLYPEASAWSQPVDGRMMTGLEAALTAHEDKGLPLRILIAATRHINARLNDGMTPLMLAALHGKTTILGDLIAAGADETLQAPDGRRPRALLESLADEERRTRGLQAFDAGLAAREQARAAEAAQGIAARVNARFRQDRNWRGLKLGPRR